MAYLQPDKEGKVYLPAIRTAKENGEKLVCLTAYDYPTARIVDEAGVDIILVGDSMGNVVHGYGNTIPVSIDEIISACIAVKRGTERAMVVADMPFGSYHVNEDESVKNALRLMKYGGAEAVKLEGGRNRAKLVERLVSEEIPVVSHIGLTPQSVYKMGGYRVQGKTQQSAEILKRQAHELQDAGASMLVLEMVPAPLSRELTIELTHCATIGIGAGSGTAGQVLVLHDMLGVNLGKNPKFVRNFMEGTTSIRGAMEAYVAAVKNGSFPVDALHAW